MLIYDYFLGINSVYAKKTIYSLISPNILFFNLSGNLRD